MCIRDRGKADAILALGSIVGLELGYAPIPILEVTRTDIVRFPDRADVCIEAQGRITVT